MMATVLVELPAHAEPTLAAVRRSAALRTSPRAGVHHASPFSSRPHSPRLPVSPTKGAAMADALPPEGPTGTWTFVERMALHMTGWSSPYKGDHDPTSHDQATL